MKFGMTSLTFKTKSIEETMKIAKKAGVECIEWGVSEGHVCGDESVDEIKKLSIEYGIEICSLGSYCYLEDEEHCMETVELARKLAAPIIRVWAGKKSPDDCDDEYYNFLVENARKMADEAAKHAIMLSFEYHRKSLTETSESAIKFLNAIGRDNVKTHWQAESVKSIGENIEGLKAVSPYLSGIFHVSNYSREKGFMLIEDIKDRVITYFNDYKDTNFRLLVEFTKDAAEESIISDIRALKEVLG